MINFALAFPDIYEVGMSHLGLRILYDIINKLPHASAERVFAPWTDIEDYMKKNRVLLSSLETCVPLKDFDVVGFSLQYELSYTTVLNMLHLGGIPIYSGDRINSMHNFPLVIAGGPCTVNPLPMSPFIDVFLIGDGECAVVELIDIVREWKLSGSGRKEFLLKEISNLEGFYVPFVHKSGAKIKRRLVEDLDAAPYPLKPVVPYAPIVHDRINIEVSRGCSMGCRFCQAGMIYRPARERSPESVLRIAEESLNNTGYDEVSLTSLSAGDYTYLKPLVREFNRRFGESKIALSLPSLRVAAVSQEVLGEIRSVRKTGFTIAPEAATERMRDIINKDFSNDDYENALKVLFSEGWLNLKMYFMIGLPLERDEDIEAIGDMAVKAIRIAKQNTKKFVNIGITISPFVPKTHTPFQWCGQISLEEIKRKQNYLREMLRAKKIKYKGHDEGMSFLEAVFARGDERLSALIEEAWRQGCRLDGWSDFFDFRKWLNAMDKIGIDGRLYAERDYGTEEKLPWDIVDTGIKKEFLIREYKRAISGQITQDCRRVCTVCGLKCKEKEKLGIGEIITPIHLFSHSPVHKIKVRVQFSKTGSLRYLSHLETVTAIIRGLRRANIPFDFTKGFHPTPRVSFGPPLSVGVAGEKEYFDMEVFAPFDIEFYLERLRNTLPAGIGISKMTTIPMEEPSLNSFVRRYEYRIRGEFVDSLNIEWADSVIGESLIVMRDGRNVDIKPCVERVSVYPSKHSPVKNINLILRDHDDTKVRIGEIVKAVFGMDTTKLDITRTAIYGTRGADMEWVEPL